MDIFRDAKRRGIYLPLFIEPEGDSCYQIRWIKKRFLNFLFCNFRETTHHLSLGSQNSEYSRIFRVTGANQNARKLLSTDLVNTKCVYLTIIPRARVGYEMLDNSQLGATRLFAIIISYPTSSSGTIVLLKTPPRYKTNRLLVQ